MKFDEVVFSLLNYTKCTFRTFMYFKKPKDEKYQLLPLIRNNKNNTNTI